MIAASVLFLAAAIATFLAGVFSTGLQMIGVSIGCSAAAALLLLGGVLRDSRRRPTVAPAGLSVPARDIAAYVAPPREESYAAAPEVMPQIMPESEETPELVPAFDEGLGTSTIDLDAARDEFYGTPGSYDEEPAEISSYDEEEPVVEQPAAPAPRKTPARKPAAKKAAPRKIAAKPAAKPVAKKTAAKPSARKPAAKPAAKKPAARKPAARKPSARKPSGE